MAAAKPASQADFLRTMAELAGDLKAYIEAEVDGFSIDPVASAERRQQAEADFAFFCRTYFPHYVSTEASVFHRFLFKRLPEAVDAADGARESIAAPRGNAKTTYGQIFHLWCDLTDRKHFMCLMSDSFDQAAEMLEGIKAELEVNPRLAADYPDRVGKGRAWKVGVIVTNSGHKIQAFGSGKRLRGVRHGARRPDMVWLDDIENDENVRSPEQRDKLESWIDKAVDPLGPPDGSMDIFYVGTILHYDAVLARKLNNPMWQATRFKAVIRWPDRMDLWDRWEEVMRNDGKATADAFHALHQSEMETGAEVLWPAVQPFKRLMEIRVRVGRAAFDSEYMNDPISDADAMFAKVTFWVDRLRHWVFFGVCDPSLGKKSRRNDPSAVLVGGLNRETGVLDVVEAAIRRRLPDKIISDIIALHQEYHCLRWGIESVQFQEFFRTELVRRSAIMGCPVPAVPILNSDDKELRIESLQPHVANGLIRFNPNHATLLEQLRHWPHADHDDGPDALEMLWRIVRSAGGTSGARTGGIRSAGGRYSDFIGG